jgi:hypothetical protein
MLPIPDDPYSYAYHYRYDCDREHDPIEDCTNPADCDG